LLSDKGLHKPKSEIDIHSQFRYIPKVAEISLSEQLKDILHFLEA